MLAIIVPNLANPKPRNFCGLFRIAPCGQVGHFGQVLDNVQNVQNSNTPHTGTLIAVSNSTDTASESTRMWRQRTLQMTKNSAQPGVLWRAIKNKNLYRQLWIERWPKIFRLTKYLVAGKDSCKTTAHMVRTCFHCKPPKALQVLILLGSGGWI